MATDLYTVIPGLEVSQDEILQAEMAAEKILEARYPDMDLRQGTGLRDLVIRPTATLLALVNKAVVYYFAQNTLPGITDTSPTEVVDKILSNWFMERKAGKKSVVSARMYFATRKNVTINSSVFFSTDNTRRFYPISTYSFSGTDFSYESFSGEYYVDIDLIAGEEGSEYDMSSGSLLYFTNFDPYFLRGEINYLREIATATETNSKFIERTKTAVSTRNLINTPSIEARLREDFDYIDAVTSIGFGDPEMYRDQVEVVAPPAYDPVTIHIGGKTDVYARVPLQTEIFQYVTNTQGVIDILGPYMEISRSDVTGGSEDDTLPTHYETPVTSLTCVLTTATAVATNHGYKTGDTIIIAGAFPIAYNGSYVITRVDDNTFTYPLAAHINTVATGAVVAKTPVVFEVSNPAQKVANVFLTKEGDHIKVAALNHGLLVDRRIELFESEIPALDGWYVVRTTAKDSFTIDLPAAAPVDLLNSRTSMRYVQPLQDFGFSANQIFRVNFGTPFASRTVSFKTLGFQGLNGLQTYLSQEDRRVLAGDILARGLNTYLLSFHIVGYNGPPPSSGACAAVIKEYLEFLKPGEPFIMADLISRLNTAGVGTLKTPLEVTYRYFQRDNAPFTTGTILDFLDPNDRTSTFSLDSITTSNEYI